MFFFDMLDNDNVFGIINNADLKERLIQHDNNFSDERENWLIKIIQIYTPKSPLLASIIVHKSINNGYKGYEKFPDELLKLYKAEFIIARKRLLPSLGKFRFALANFLNVICKYDNYQQLKNDFTQRIINEADTETDTELRENIIFSLVNTTSSSPQNYQFSVDKTTNEKKYDMNSMLSALQRWNVVKWNNDFVKDAFYVLKNIYNI